jgi:hypothetical protein
MRFTSFLVLAIVGVAKSVRAAEHPIKGGQPIIIDTDLFSDVDDVGALTIANVFNNCGLADLRGIVINSPSQYGALAASVSKCAHIKTIVEEEFHSQSFGLIGPLYILWK